MNKIELKLEKYIEQVKQQKSRTYRSKYYAMCSFAKNLAKKIKDTN